ncbi:hypothetical protein FM107_04305 [Sphingobacterium sp. JB170]|nr:hypothetical protein FM107_04305 [Sphingobacterium sp. JB170]
MRAKILKTYLYDVTLTIFNVFLPQMIIVGPLEFLLVL